MRPTQRSVLARQQNSNFVVERTEHLRNATRMRAFHVHAVILKQIFSTIRNRCSSLPNDVLMQNSV